MKSTIKESIIRLLDQMDEDLLATIYNILIRLIGKG